ncbi:MAG: hypothetical protein MJ252_16830 [archaeon]|nr:hypothetical protein [archaeon]
MSESRYNKKKLTDEYKENKGILFNSKLSLRKGGISNLLDEKRFMPQYRENKNRSNFNNLRLIDKSTELTNMLNNYVYNQSDNTIMDGNLQYEIISKINNYLDTNDDIEFLNLLIIIINWLYLKKETLNIFSSKDLISKIIFKTFHQFENNSQIAERTIILLSFILKADQSIIEKETIGAIFQEYSEILKDPSLFIKYTDSMRREIEWSFYQSIIYIEREQPISFQFKKSLLEVSLNELNILFSSPNMTIKSNSCEKMVNTNFNIIIKLLQTEKENIQIFDPLTVYKIYYSTVWLNCKFFTFTELSHPDVLTGYVDSQKLALEILKEVFTFDDSFLTEFYDKVDLNYLFGYIDKSYFIYRDNEKAKRLFKDFLEFFAKLSSHSNPKLIQLFSQFKENYFVVSNNHSLTLLELEICYNLYCNFPFDLCLKFFGKSDFETIIKGLERRGNEKAVFLLLKTIINKYSEANRLGELKDILINNNIYEDIEQNINNTEDEEILNEGQELLNFMNATFG